MRMGFLELAVVLVILLLVIGPKQIPKLTEALSKSSKQLKEELKKDEESQDNKIEE